MPTTFDDVYRYFISITKVDEYDLPTSTEGQYDLINNGRLEFNLRREDDLKQDNETELFSREMTDLEVMLIGNCMKLVVIRNMLAEFTSTYSMFQKEVGYKDYKSQLAARDNLVKMQVDVIKDIVFAMQEDYQ